MNSSHFRHKEFLSACNMPLTVKRLSPMRTAFRKSR
jgi:hypothetical protein